MEGLDGLKSRIEHELAVGKMTVRQAFDRIEDAAEKAVKDEIKNFGGVQAREATKRPWLMPALFAGALVLGFIIGWIAG